MRRTPAFRAVAVLTLAVVAASCATTQLPPISATGAAFEPLRDERVLWDEARAEEDKLLAEVALYDDPLLVDYLEGLVGRLEPAGMAANPEIAYRGKVGEDPTLNAFAYPHGAMFVHTGLLARMENEDQLATVLAHEMTHVENRHMLRFRRSARNKQVALSVAAVAAAVVIAGEQGDAYGQGDWARGATIGVLGDLLVGLGLQLAFLASINGYGRDLEIEADRGGFTKVAAAGYAVAQAPRVYELLLDDHGEPNRAEAFFFGSHPRLTERIESSRAWVAAHPAAAPTPEQAAGDGEPAASPAGSADSFERRMRPVVRDDARLNLEMGRLELAEAELDRARAAMPEDPEVHLLTGRLKLARADAAKDPEVQAALRDDAWAAFEEAVRLDPGRPAPHRELGLLAYRGGDHERACAELRRYVELAPEADDAARVRDYLLELDADGRCGEAR
jgi:predicted Zn-dependent protease